ncbi:hypothetical protein ACH4SP_22030 [Streptomyces sp. NPDC021093]|uniref:hypothetical protein n=1 Tax=Streptomyces sp. NPDC021093 TaxID=3365112 RepID=UPI003787D80A
MTRVPPPFALARRPEGALPWCGDGERRPGCWPPPAIERPEGGPTSFTLPPGATGFTSPGDESLPVADLRAFRAALRVAARAARGEVAGLKARSHPLAFHTASVRTRTGESVLLCQAHLPWTAFVREHRWVYEEEFLAPPEWAGSFGNAGFEVLSRERLVVPVGEVDVSGLAEFERGQIRYYATGTLVVCSSTRGTDLAPPARANRTAAPWSWRSQRLP